MRTVLLTSMLLACATAGAAARADEGPAATALALAPPSVGPRSTLGLAIDVGVPEGIAAALTFRPAPVVRLWAGPAWNYVAWGVHGGAALVPWSWAVSPALSVEVGRFFDADLTRFVNDGTGAPGEVEPLLRSVGYDYAAVHLGLELGSQRGVSFSIRAGLAHVRARSRGTARSTSDSSGGTTDVSVQDPQVNARIPSLKLGLQLAF